MKRAFVLLALVCGCGSSSPGDRLDGDWLFTNAEQTGGIALSFKGSSYSVASMVLTSSSSFEASVDKGTFAATDSTIAMTPTQSSCPGPDPASVVNYRFVGSSLALSDSSGTTVTFAPNNGPSGSTTVVIQTGCFAQDGTFTPAPVAPVSN